MDIRYSSDVTLRSRTVYSRMRVFNPGACYWVIDKQCLRVNQESISGYNYSQQSASVCDIYYAFQALMSSQGAYSLEIISALWINALWQRFGYVTITWGLIWECYGDLWQLTCVTMSETPPEDHLIIFREFLTGNKAHATSSSIQARVNCLKVRVNCSQASVKLHLSCTI